jgi:hypothetical protein
LKLSLNPNISLNAMILTSETKTSSEIGGNIFIFVSIVYDNLSFIFFSYSWLKAKLGNTHSQDMSKLSDEPKSIGGNKRDEIMKNVQVEMMRKETRIQLEGAPSSGSTPRGRYDESFSPSQRGGRWFD